MKYLSDRTLSSLLLFGALVTSSTLGACGDDTAGGGGEGAQPSGAGGEGASTTGGGGQGGDPGSGGTGGEGGETTFAPAPPLRNPVDLPDEELAYESLMLMGHQPLGATTTTCSKCHSMNSGLLSNWLDLTNTAVSSCFVDTEITTASAARAALDCMRQKPAVETSPFSTPKLGIYSAAAHLDWFDAAFDRAYGPDAAAEKEAFLQAVAMPKENTPFTQAELDVVAEWFARGLPLLDVFLPDDPPVTGCTQSITPAVGEHVAAMAAAGWRAKNAENGILMFGCAGAATPLDCLSSYPQAGTLAFGTGWEHLAGAKLRVLRTSNYNSSFWTRSSADGRFVGHGGGQLSGSTIVDLQPNVEIAVDAAYDPGFFPDNGGFMFQGAAGGTGICKQGLLSSTPASVTFLEPECENTAQVGLYQHIGAALNGGDYWIVDSEFVSDNGGLWETTDNPGAYFGNSASVVLTPMINDGSGFTPKTAIGQSTPFEGDTVISPSSGLLMGRVATGGWDQAGFRLRKLEATPNGNSYTVTTPEIGRYCFNGGKPGFSYDERWAVIHRYVTGEDAVELGFTGPNDPAFSSYANQGAANVYLMDLVTGLVRRITHMKPGQYAVFPHFRSDGWIYFMVRTVNQNYEYIVASDAALTLENQP